MERDHGVARLVHCDHWYVRNCGRPLSRDHAIARVERGLAGVLMIEGPPNPEIYNGQVMSGMGH
jgi:hypothetical protein